MCVGLLFVCVGERKRGTEKSCLPQRREVYLFFYRKKNKQIKNKVLKFIRHRHDENAVAAFCTPFVALYICRSEYVCVYPCVSVSYFLSKYPRALWAILCVWEEFVSGGPGAGRQHTHRRKINGPSMRTHKHTHGRRINGSSSREV